MTSADTQNPRLPGVEGGGTTRRGMHIKLAATYLGAVVGAGFASGQEHLHFFGQFSPGGGIGVMLAGLLFVLFGVLLADLAARYGTSSPGELLGHVVGKALAPPVDVLLATFMFCSVAVMLAGSGALFREQVGLASNVGVGLTAAVTMIATRGGIDGLLYLNTLMSPVLLGAPILTALLSLVWAWRGILRPPCSPGPDVALANSLIPAWPIASVLYVSYNLLLVVGIFASMGDEFGDARCARRGATLGGLALAVFMVALHITLTVHGDDMWQQEVPMLTAASYFGPLLRAAYSTCLWFAMVTTAVTACFSLARRLEGRLGISHRALAVVVTVVAGLLAQYGFANLVSRLYPVFGYLGLPLVFGLALTSIKIRLTIIR